MRWRTRPDNKLENLITTFRWDTATDVNLKNLSIREICTAAISHKIDKY